MQQSKHKEAPKKDSAEDTEENSNIILRPGSRLKQQDEIAAAVQGRSYLPLEELNDKSAAGIFTVGVVVDRSGVLTSKAGKKFVSFKISDLQKYDREKVR